MSMFVLALEAAALCVYCALLAEVIPANTFTIAPILMVQAYILWLAFKRI